MWSHAVRRQEITQPLGPFFSDSAQVRFAEIFGRHGGMEFDVSVEAEKPRLGERGDLRGVVEIDDDDAATLASELGEVSRFGLGFCHDLLDSRSRGTVFHIRVKGLDREFYVDEDSHG